MVCCVALSGVGVGVSVVCVCLSVVCGCPVLSVKWRVWLERHILQMISQVS